MTHAHVAPVFSLAPRRILLRRIASLEVALLTCTQMQCCELSGQFAAGKLNTCKQLGQSVVLC